MGDTCYNKDVYDSRLLNIAQWARKWKRKIVNENLTDPIISAGLCLISAGLTA